jgi:hypothetical protein
VLLVELRLLVGAVVLTQLVFFGEEVAHALLGTNSLASHAHPTRISLATRSSLLAPKCFFNNFRKKIAKSRFLQVLMPQHVVRDAYIPLSL